MALHDNVLALRNRRIEAGNPPVSDALQGVSRAKIAEVLTALALGTNADLVGFSTTYRTWREAAARQSVHGNVAVGTDIRIQSDPARRLLVEGWKPAIAASTSAARASGSGGVREARADCQCSETKEPNGRQKVKLKQMQRRSTPRLKLRGPVNWCVTMFLDLEPSE